LITERVIGVGPSRRFLAKAPRSAALASGPGRTCNPSRRLTKILAMMGINIRSLCVVGSASGCAGKSPDVGSSKPRAKMCRFTSMTGAMFPPPRSRFQDLRERLSSFQIKPHADAEATVKKGTPSPRERSGNWPPKARPLLTGLTSALGPFVSRPVGPALTLTRTRSITRGSQTSLALQLHEARETNRRSKRNACVAVVYCLLSCPLRPQMAKPYPCRH